MVKAARPGLEILRQEALEAKSNFWTDPCAELGAKRKRKLSRIFKKGTLCQCVQRGWVATSECSRPGQRVFSLMGNAAGCRCEEGTHWAKSVKSPVETAALAFCEAVAREGEEDQIPRVSVCEEQLSNRAATGDYGRLAGLDALLAGAPKTAEWHLTRVCRDECKELVNTTKREMTEMWSDMSGIFMQGDHDSRPIPVGETCAARVVKKVEAEIFGCCGRSCGWNGRSCISWPFFDEQQKADWQAECCTEYNASISVDSKHSETHSSSAFSVR